MSKLLKQKNRSSKIGLAVLINVVIVFFLIIGFGREYLASLQVEREISQLEDQYSTLQEEKLSTLKLIEQLSSEYYLEKQARTKHGLAKDGEKLIIVKNDNSNAFSDTTVAGEEDFIFSAPNPLKWYYYFFDMDRFSELVEL